MAITSREIKEEEPRRAAIVSRAALAKQQPLVKRGLAFGLFGASVGGSLLWGGGGLAAWLALHPNWGGVLAAIAAQVVCSAVQWVWCHDGWNPYYLVALAVSSATTALGFWPLVHPGLTRMLQSLDGALWTFYGPHIAGVLIVLGALIADIYPEKVLTL